MVEASTKELGLERVRLAPLLLNGAKIGLYRPLGGDPGELLLAGKRPTISDPLGHQASRDQPSRLQGRRKNQRTDQEKRHRRQKDGDGDQEA